MATNDHIAQVETIIQYTFRSKDYLRRALIAAGAEEENHDGNRKLAYIGDSLIRYILSLVAYETLPSRSQITYLETSFVSISERSSVAKRTGIANCIKFSSKPGGQSGKVLALAISAILGAVHKDSNELNAAWGVALHLGLVTGSWNCKTLPSPALVATGLNSKNVSSDGEAKLQQITEFTVLHAGSPEHLNSTANIVQGQLESQSTAATGGQFLPEDETTDLLPPCPLMLGDDDWFSLFLDLGGTTSADASNLPFIPEADRSEHIRCDNDAMSAASENQEVVTVSPSKKRKFHPENPENTKQRRVLPPGTRCRLNHKDLIEKFVIKEDGKCSRFNCPSVELTYFSRSICNDLEGMEPHMGALSRFLLYVASSESIVVLKRIIQMARRKPDSSVRFVLQPEQSKKSRFHLIDVLGEELAWCRLLRAIHVLELYKACGGSINSHSDGFIVSTAQSVQTHKKQPGNPLHAAETKIVREMMSEILPELSPDTEEYHSKQKVMKKLRVFGRRLSSLVDSFGPGVLGLMMSDDISGLGVSELTLLNLTEEKFNEFINILKRSQGELLVSFGRAVQGVLDALVSDTLPENLFPIENLDTELILECPKGSKELLNRISQTRSAETNF